ncbi:MAG: hypothetical protein QW719_03170 [Candidatus Micrarchaeaceae archaeon]
MMRNVYIALLVVLASYISIAGYASAFVSNPLFSGSLYACKQLNASYIICPDGANITVSFSISAPYAPYYGNFSVYPLQYANESLPLNIFGGQCVVQSQSTKTCTIKLAPFSVFTGNATNSRTVSLLLVSSIYPQVRYQQNFSVMVMHYLTSSEEMLLGFFNATYANFTRIANSYSYFCSSYQICNASLASDIAAIGSEISNASSAMNASNLGLAYSSIAAASNATSEISPIARAFINSSNAIVNYIMKGRASLANATSLFAENKQVLQNCSPAYVAKFNATLAGLSAYTDLGTLAGAAYFANSTQSALANETAVLAKCRSKPLPQVGAILKPNIYITLAFVAIIIVLAAYVYFRLRGSFEVRSMRSEQEEGTGAAPPAANLGRSQDLESSFDKWFESTIAKHGDSKKGKKQS